MLSCKQHKVQSDYCYLDLSSFMIFAINSGAVDLWITFMWKGDEGCLFLREHQENFEHFVHCNPLETLDILLEWDTLKISF